MRTHARGFHWHLAAVVLLLLMGSWATPARGQEPVLVDPPVLQDTFGTPMIDSALDAVVDQVGNTYVVGHVTGELPGQVALGDQDGFIRKYDASGTLVWTRQFGTTVVDQLSRVAIDDAGLRLYVIGTVQVLLPGGEVDAYPGFTFQGGFNDAYVRAYDLNGAVLWTDQFGTTENDQAHAVSYAAGRVYVAGVTTGDLVGGSPGGGDAFLRAYDATTGMVQWTQQFGTSEPPGDDSFLGFDQASGLAADPLGVFVSGFTQSDSGEAMPSADFPQVPYGGWDAWLRRYHSNGNEAWTRQIGTSGFEGNNGVAADGSGAYVLGRTNSVMPSVDSTEASAGSFDIWVRKYDFGGNEEWTRQFGSDGLDLGQDIAAGAAGVYAALGAGGTLPGHPPANGIADAAVRAYRSDGTPLWTGVLPDPNARGVAAARPDILPVVPYVYLVGISMGEAYVSRAFLHDADGDGVDDAIQTGLGSFSDGGTSGSITDAAGLLLFVNDHADPAEGVVAWVGPGSPGAKAEFNVCGGFKVKVSAGGGAWNQAEFSPAGA